MSLLKTSRLNFLSKLWIPLLILAGTVLLTYMTVFVGFLNGALGVLLIVACAGAFMMFYRYTTGVYFLFFLTTFMPWASRMFGFNFPFGILYDAIIVVAFTVMMFTDRERVRWMNFRNPMTTVLMVVIAYQLLLAINPQGHPVAWAVSLRRYLIFVLYFIFMQMFLKRENLKLVTNLFLVMAFLVAAYGIYQEWVGMPDAELKWIRSDDARYSVYYVWGQLRKMSLLSDPSAFGMFMGYSAITCLLLTFRSPKTKQKILFGILTMMMFMGSSYSGTRTAYLMIVIGMGLYFLLTLKNTKTLMGALAVALVFLFIIYGPIYNYHLNRIRSAFRPNEDKSMGVRDLKRLKFQPYIQTNPIGGGMYTTAGFGKQYAPGHRFAGFDPDSGYLETALESGWIGLIVLFTFVGTIVIFGFNQYFRLRDPTLQTYLLIYLIPFFTVTIAHYAQNAYWAKPMDLLFAITMATVAQVTKLDKTPSANSSLN